MNNHPEQKAHSLTKISLCATRNGTFWTLPLNPKIDRSGGNEIVMSRIAKNYDHGTVKESWGRGDWRFDVKGVLIDMVSVNGTGQPIHQQMDALTKLLTNKVLHVQGEHFAEIGVYQVVVLDWKLAEVAGSEHQAYHLTLISDFPFELV